MGASPVEVGSAGAAEVDAEFNCQVFFYVNAEWSTNKEGDFADDVLVWNSKKGAFAGFFSARYRDTRSTSLVVWGQK